MFSCSKCKHYSYVRISQKGKKCLRCGRAHVVVNLDKISEVVNGVTAARDRVIQLQNELATQELGGEPALRAASDFYLPISGFKTLSPISRLGADREERGLFIAFKSVLEKLHQHYKKYPPYLIELLALDRGISKEESKLLMAEFLNKGLLKKTRDGLFFLSC